MSGHKPTDLTRENIMPFDPTELVDLFKAISNIFGGAGNLITGLSFFS